MIINSISDFRKAYRNGPYAWPGGYPLYWVMGDGAALSFDVAKLHRRDMLEALADKDICNCDAGWRPDALEINWEDPNLYCDVTNKRIESAYAEHETGES